MKCCNGDSAKTCSKGKNCGKKCAHIAGKKCCDGGSSQGAAQPHAGA
jgi:hypothetical protein